MNWKVMSRRDRRVGVVVVGKAWEDRDGVLVGRTCSRRVGEDSRLVVDRGRDPLDRRGSEVGVEENHKL